MMNLTAIDLKTKASKWTLVVLLFISLFTISGGLGHSPITDQKTTTSKLAGKTDAVRRTQIFYKSFIQKIRAVNFLHIFLSCSNNLLLLIKSMLVQIQFSLSLMRMLVILPIGYLFVRTTLNYNRRRLNSLLAPIYIKQ
ncbi:hypothetical protein [Pedobacter sp. NJ-S-72]